MTDPSLVLQVGFTTLAVMPPPKLRVVVEAPEDGSQRREHAALPPLPDPANLDQVFRRFAPYVARIAARILGQTDELDDLVQDVFLDAQRGLSQLRDASLVRAWLATVTVRKAKRRLQRRRWVHWVGLESAIDPPVADPSTSTRDHALILAVYRVLDSVTPEERIAWIMHRVEGESLEDIATACDCSRATAHRLVMRAQAALEKGLGSVGTT